ncbi:MAG: hypothetical protein IJW24_02750 [Clostridia bacterium]|nr:hypothetical protein [Clostridia bacterium]
MKNFIQDLTTDQICKLCYDLHLGEFDHAELIEQKIGETFFNLSVTNAPPKGIPLTYSFSNHGVVNSGFEGMFVCEEFDEFEMLEHNPLTIHINQYFMRFMSQTFPDYLTEEIDHREQNIKNLVEVIKKNAKIIDTLQEYLSKKTMKLHELSDTEFDDAAQRISNFGKIITALETNLQRQHKEALYHDTMMRLALQEAGRNPQEPAPLDSRFDDNFDIAFYKPDDFIDDDPDQNEDIHETSQEDEDYSYEFENNPGLEDFIPDDQFYDEDEDQL